MKSKETFVEDSFTGYFAHPVWVRSGFGGFGVIQTKCPKLLNLL